MKGKISLNLTLTSQHARLKGMSDIAGVPPVLAAPQGRRDTSRRRHLQAGARRRVLQGQLGAVQQRRRGEGTQKCHRLEYSLLKYSEISHSFKSQAPSR